MHRDAQCTPGHDGGCAPHRGISLNEEAIAYHRKNRVSPHLDAYGRDQVELKP
jgi:hypothetical protein